MPLLLSPYRLQSDHVAIQILEVAKSPRGTDFNIYDITSSTLRKTLPDLPREAKDVLLWFNKEGVTYTRNEIKKTYNVQRSGLSFDDYYRSSMGRRLHDLFVRLKPFVHTVRWYQRIKTPAGSFRTAPCSFSDFRPQLAFDVIQEGQFFQLVTFIVLNGQRYALHQFTRAAFLLESNAEYFLLSYKDFQTLEWLADNKDLQRSDDAQNFSSVILAKLEKDYPVNTNNLFAAEVIREAPVRRVLLSEISNSFLVLTPQWLYGGFVAEGPWQDTMPVSKDGTSYHVRRDETEEMSLRRLLESLHPNFTRQLNGYYYLSFADAQKKHWFAKTFHTLLDEGIEIAGMDMLKHFRYSPHKAETEISIAEQNDDQIVLSVTVAFNKEKVTLSELQKILWAGQKAVLLKDGSLGLLHNDWLGRYAGIIKHGKVAGNTITAGRWILLTGAVDADKKFIRNEWWQKWARWQTADSEEIFALPTAITINSLRPYQQKGYEWLRLLAEAGCSGCLADDMGLGKTLQTICFLVARLQEATAAKHLVVCPSSLIYNWQAEFVRFAPTVSTSIFHGLSRDGSVLDDDATRVIITSYGTVRNDIEKLSEVFFDCIVVDESHTIKNPSALTSRAVSQLRSRLRTALSGTPVMNNTFDLYGQLNFVMPGMLGAREFFKREYADPIDRNREPEKLMALQKLTAPFILRRTKEQVAPELPEKTESILWCEMDSDQRYAYESIRDNIRDNLFLEIRDKGLNSGKLSVLHGIMKLRQVCNSSELVKDESIFNYDSVKIKVLVEELQNTAGKHKALVFSQFTSMLDLIGRELERLRISYLRLDGSTPAETRLQLVNRFNSDDSHEKVFLLSLKAGNAGLNLTAADYVFLVDPWWNRAVEQQAIDRTHRIGQTKSVFAYRMICKNTIEEKILVLQQRKNALSEELVGGEEGFVKNLSEDDLHFLFT